MIVGFFAGIASALRGFSLAVGDANIRRSYRKLMLVIGGSTLAIDALAVWQLIVPVFSDDYDLDFSTSIAYIVSAILVLLFAPLVVMLLTNIIAPVFNRPPFYAGFRALNPARANELAAKPGFAMRTSMAISTRRSLRTLLLVILAFAVSFIPLIGAIIGPVLSLYVASRGLAWELMDPYFEALGLRYPEQRQFLSKHRSKLVGFGLPFSFVFSVPIVGPLIFGIAQAAIPKLIVDHIET